MAWTYKNLSSVQDANSVYQAGYPAYFWTVDCYEAGGQTAVAVPVNTDNKSVYKGNTIYYVVRVWKQNALQLNPTSPATPLTRDDDLEVYVLDSYRNAQAANFEISEVEWRKHEKLFKRKTVGDFPYYTDPGYSVSSSGVTTDAETTKRLFVFTVRAKKSNVFLQPDIYVKLKKNGNENNSNEDREVLPHSSTYVTGISFTNAISKTTSIPKIVKQEAYQEELIALDRCSTPNRWAAVIKELDIKPNAVNWSLRYYPLDADNMSPAVLKQNVQTIYIGYDSKVGVPGPDGVDHGRVARTRLTEIRNNTCKEAEDGGPSEEPDFDRGRPEDFKDYSRTNPPNHFYTRSPSHWSKIKDQYLKDTKTTRRASFVVPGKKDLLYQETSEKGVLGMLFQDTQTAKALNADTKKPWGFRFIYNPTYVSYGTQMDTSIDWILATHDPANYIGGSFSVSVQLYLNRVVDMTELAPLKGKNQPYSKNYPRGLTAQEVEGILHRGTEYDLEFLYRVVNGDPKESSGTLLSYSEGGSKPKTADFGYITGTPVWLKIHPNMRYKVSLASLNVNHVIFSEQMIPMFSIVDLQFIRYPVISDTDEKVQQAWSDKKKKVRTANVEKEGEQPSQ